MWYIFQKLSFLIFIYYKIGLFLSPLMRSLRLVLGVSEIMTLWSWAWISFQTYFKCYIQKSLSCFVLVQRPIRCYSLLKRLYYIITWQQYFNDTTCLWSAPHLLLQWWLGPWINEVTLYKPCFIFWQFFGLHLHRRKKWNGRGNGYLLLNWSNY